MSLSRLELMSEFVIIGNLALQTAAHFMISSRSGSSNRRTYTRRYAVNPVNRDRLRQGFYRNLVQEMRLKDESTFINFHRMSVQAFDDLLRIVGPHIQRSHVTAISPGERLSLTLRGDSMVFIGRYSYRLGKTTTSNIIRETWLKLWECLKEAVFPIPNSLFWENTAEKFYQLWNFPHCLSAMDGKHVIIQAFGNSGSICRNYKSSYSVIFFAKCDAEYRFIMVDIGATGHNGDITIFRRSSFGKSILSGGQGLNLPAERTLRRSNIIAPYVFIGDEAFPLLRNLLRLFPGRNTRLLPEGQQSFNHRLSRARRIVENAFGILSGKWRIYRRPILASKPTVNAIIKATVVLDNWLINRAGSTYITPESTDPIPAIETRGASAIEGISRVGSNNPSIEARIVRESFLRFSPK